MLHSYFDRYHRSSTCTSIEQRSAVFQETSKYLSYDISYNYSKVSLVIIIGFDTAIFTKLYLTL